MSNNIQINLQNNIPIKLQKNLSKNISEQKSQNFVNKIFQLHCSICDGEPDRLDKILTNLIPFLPFDLSRSQLTQFIIRMLVNGVEAKNSSKVMKGDEIYITLKVPHINRSHTPQAISLSAQSTNKIIDKHTSENLQGLVINNPLPNIEQKQELHVIYEDNTLLVVNKPRGMVVHPGAGNHDQILSELVFDKLVDFRQEDLFQNRAGIVHRLDKDTSGIILIAKTARMHEQLALLFANRSITKKYLAIVSGIPQNRAQTIEGYIGRSQVNRKKYMVVASEKLGKFASTSYRVLHTRNNFSIVSCHPHTGRTHQIRVHMQHIGHPIVGDRVYSRKDFRYYQLKSKDQSEIFPIDSTICPLMLHAYSLEFSLPVLNKEQGPLADKNNSTKPEHTYYEFTAPLPQDMRFAFEHLEAKQLLSKIQ